MTSERFAVPSRTVDTLDTYPDERPRDDITHRYRDYNENGRRGMNIALENLPPGIPPRSHQNATVYMNREDNPRSFGGRRDRGGHSSQHYGDDRI